MLNIEQLRRARAELNIKIQSLAASEKETEGGLSAEKVAEFDALTGEFDSLTAQIKRLEKAEATAAAQAEPVAAYGVAPAVHVKSEAETYKGSAVARIAMSVAAGNGSLVDAAKFAATELNDKEVQMAIETTAGSGGALIPQNKADEVIDLLRPKTVVRALGAVPVPLPNGNMSMPKMILGAQSSYVGEGSDSGSAESEFGEVSLSAKTMITLVPIANQMIGRAGPRIERIVLNDMLSSMAVREDKGFLRDDGSNNTPTGFRKVAVDAGNIVVWSGTANLATIDAYLDSLVLNVMESDSMLVSPGWAMSPRTFMKLQGLRDGNGNKAYPEMAQGMLKGWPIKHTTTIPVNLGAGTESEIYFADWNDVVIGETDEMSIDFSKEATYADGNGDLVSAFSRNQSLIRVVMGHDVGFRHDGSLVMGTAVTF